MSERKLSFLERAGCIAGGLVLAGPVALLGVMGGPTTTIAPMVGGIGLIAIGVNGKMPDSSESEDEE